VPQTGPDPAGALRRIAFLLERRLAETYKVKAFRGAAATVLATGPVELAERAAEGTLRQLPGIGKATEAVVLDVLAGRVPAYLADLEAEAGPLATGGEQVRRALRGDLHTHSDWSDGGSPIEEMVMTAVEVGHEYLALTDHSPRLKVANGLSAARLARQLEVVEAVNAHLGGRVRLLKGIEVDILEDGGLDQSEELLGRLDVVVASVHSKLRMERGPMTRRMLAAVRHPRTNVLGHCTGRLVTGGRGKRPQSEFDAEAVFAACRDHGVAVEINSRPERQDPPDDLLELAVATGCLFSIDSDAHAPGQLDFLDYGATRAHTLGVPVERVVNTWPLDELLAWAGK
jgi:putative hydrolase